MTLFSVLLGELWRIPDNDFLSPGFATMLRESGARVPSYRRFMLLGDKTSIAKWANQNLGQQNPNSNVKAPSYGTFSSKDLNLQLEELILRWKNQLPTVGPGLLSCIPIIFCSRRMPLLSVAILLCGTASMFTGGVLVRIPALFGGMTFSFRSNKFSWTKSHRTSRFASILQEMLCVMPGVLTSTRMIHLEFDFPSTTHVCNHMYNTTPSSWTTLVAVAAQKKSLICRVKLQKHISKWLDRNHSQNLRVFA